MVGWWGWGVQYQDVSLRFCVPVWVLLYQTVDHKGAASAVECGGGGGWGGSDLVSY